MNSPRLYQFKLYTITKHHTNWKEHTSLGNAPYNYLWLYGGCQLGLYKPMKVRFEDFLKIFLFWG